MNSMDENLPPGFRFHPTDEELITYYLNNKIADRGFSCRAIAVVDLNKCEPWDLPALASMGEKEWYFFNLKDRKYPTGLRTNRATQAGYWKTTGKDKEIYRGGVIVGMKKTLVFYRGRAPKGEKSNWVMHEYRPEAKPTFKSNKDEWVVCRVFKKSTSTAKKLHQSPSSSSQQYTDALDGSPIRTNTITNKFGETIEIPIDNNVLNGLEQSRVNSSNRYYNCNTDDQIDTKTRPQNLYGISDMNERDSNWAMSKQPSADNNQFVNWNAAASGSSSGSLLNTSNMAFNSLLLKALQMRSYQPTPFNIPPLMTSDNYSSAFDTPSSQQVAGNNATTPFGTDFNANMLAASSSSQQQQQQQHVHDQDQETFSMDSIW
ncbi:unnamed protein product [Rhodiola kirilowii]